ncbi:putative holin-like toxin [Paenibacillus alvei]|nr:putative holin-like toxin [Paenibacillus alvei]MCY9540490.1 putative holin-like toxin [Paenibacillus alvei]MCY9755227.1 putative holin-like toxin [Paenibacillus alvei]MEC0080295.1 putative holin-like toxin [Paenibacillus alvei]
MSIFEIISTMISSGVLLIMLLNYIHALYGKNK